MKIEKRIIAILVGLLLWGFFLMQEELAFYGLYSLISYRVHEISAFIPFVCLLATIVWLIVLIKQIIQKKTAKADLWFTALLVVLLMFQINYTYNQSQKVHVTMPVTVESIDSKNDTITVKNAHGEEELIVVLEAPILFQKLVVVGDQEYLALYESYKSNPHLGKLSMLYLIEYSDE